jgi:hypothetical protein
MMIESSAVTTGVGCVSVKLGVYLVVVLAVEEAIVRSEFVMAMPIIL